MEDDTLVVADHGKRKVWIFLRNNTAINNGFLGFWDSTPAATISFHAVNSSFEDSRQMLGLSSQGFVFATHKEPLATPTYMPSYPFDKGVFEQQPGQQLFLLPRSPDGTWSSDPASVVFGTMLLNDVLKGCCIAVAVSGIYIIAASSEKTVYIFERSGSSWQDTISPTHIFSSYTGVDGFGELVAIESHGTAMIGALGTTRKVYIFNRGLSGWPATASSELGPHPVSSGFPGSIAISGDYAAIDAPNANKIYVYEKASTGSWDMALELSSYIVASTWFGPAIDIDDRGGGDATLVVGFKNANRALIILRSSTTNSWNVPVDLLAGADPLPDGFGRTVGALGDTIVVGSYMKKLHVYTRQLLGKISRTIAVPLSGGPQRYTLTFDGQKLAAGLDLTLCLDLDGDGESEAYTDYGLYNIIVKPNPFRSSHAEEL
jgi:hypothetical protein